MQVPIRNAPGQTSDGAFSVGGICGGKVTANTDFYCARPRRRLS